MALIYSLDAYRRRRAHLRQVPAPGVAWTDSRVAATRAGLPALVGEAGLTSGTHSTAFSEGPTLLDRGYLAEVATGRLAITAAGEAILPDEE